MTRSFITKVATIATLAVVPAIAQAQFTLNVDGGVNLRDPNASATNPTTTGTLILDFTPANVGSMGTGVISVTANALNTLPGLAAGSGVTGTIRDIMVTPTGVTGLPINDFVRIGDYTFSLTSAPGTGASLGSPTGNFGPIFLTQDEGGVTATFNARGFVTGGVFTTPTAYNARFTSQFLSQPGQAPVTIASLATQIATNPAGLPNNSFSATFLIAAPTSVVPEPSTYALMASGVAMLGVFARRRRQQA